MVGGGYQVEYPPPPKGCTDLLRPGDDEAGEEGDVAEACLRRADRDDGRVTAHEVAGQEHGQPVCQGGELFVREDDRSRLGYGGSS